MYNVFVFGVSFSKVKTTGPHAVGVVVEGEEGRLYVRVNCKDRKGLLAEIAGALEELHLQVRGRGGESGARIWGKGGGCLKLGMLQLEMVGRLGREFEGEAVGKCC